MRTLLFTNVLNQSRKLIHRYFILYNRIQLLDQSLFGSIGPVYLSVHLNFLSRAYVVTTLLSLIFYDDWESFFKTNHIIFCVFLSFFNFLAREKPFSHWFAHFRFHFYFLRFILRLRAWQHMTGFIFAKAIWHDGTIWFFFLFLLFFLNHLLINAVSNKLWVFITTIIITNIFHLTERIKEVNFCVLDGEIL